MPYVFTSNARIYVCDSDILAPSLLAPLWNGAKFSIIMELMVSVMGPLKLHYLDQGRSGADLPVTL